MTATAGHEGWYTMHLTLDNSTDYSLILMMMDMETS